MSYRAIFAAAAVLALATPAIAQKSAADIPVETFYKRAQYTNMALSPNGAKLAAIVPTPPNGRNNLVVIDIATRTRKFVTGYETFDVASFEWISDKRLCLRAADGQDVSGNFNFKGAACLDHDGGNYRDFSSARWQVVALARDDSPDAYVVSTERGRTVLDAYRMNTMNKRGQLLTVDTPGDVYRWVLDRNHVPRVAVNSPEPSDKYGDRPSYVWYRDNADSKWEKLFEFNARLTGDDVEPLAFDYDNTTLYVSHNIGRDKKAIYKYDTKARKWGDLVFEHPLVDSNGPLVFDHQQKKLVGIRFNADVPGVKWLDPKLEKLQGMLDATFPKTFNILIPPQTSGNYMLVRSFSDRDSGTFHLLDASKPSIEPLVATREWIDPDLMSERKFITYKARDGLTIPAWVTIPKGSSGKNLPLVVHIHGGPHVRGYTAASAWGRPDAQFFASRGYVVLEPEPRGSMGYGKKHYTLSFKQWGQTMQDDITDGALHLVKEGIVDKGRMCLFGASYGGYAAAMGVVKDPDLWKCTVPYLAVTDLFMLQKSTVSDGGDFLESSGFKKVIGDSDADKAYFTSSSPALHGSRIKTPMLLAMGSADRRVPIEHGAALRDAIQKAGGQVDYVVYSGEAHGWNKDENTFDFYKRVEAFFARHLKGN